MNNDCAAPDFEPEDIEDMILAVMFETKKAMTIREIQQAIIKKYGVVLPLGEEE